MTIHLDTSLLIDFLTPPFRSRDAARAAATRGHRLAVSTPVLYEWWRGPRETGELMAQEEAFPVVAAPTFDAACARTAADLYRTVRRARGREMDIVIAACAIEHGAALWTLNPADFEDVPGLTLYRP